MIVLGIESTAHTFGVGIVKNKKILANEKAAFVSDDGGMIPKDVSEHHLQMFDGVIQKALDKAEIELCDVDLISFSQGPGIGHCLRIGAFIARSLAFQLKKPIIGVNHCIAHLEIGKLQTKSKDPVLLYASGANTQVIALEGGKYRVFGETLDIGVGNFLDTFARELGFGFPGGPKVYESALSGSELIELPYSVKGMDVSFGGILTNLKQKIKKGFKAEDLCYSAQHYVFSMLLEVAERAMAHTDKKELMLGGGVACNKLLQEMAQKMCVDRGAKLFVLENQYNVDNGAMIAWLGYVMYKARGKTGMSLSDCYIKPYERTDDIEVFW